MHKIWIVASVVALAFGCSAAQAASDVAAGGSTKLCYLAATAGEDNTESALTFCNDALSENVTSRDRAATYDNRGIVLLTLNQFREAEADFNRAIALRPDLGDGYLNRGAVYIAHKRYQEALDDINKSITLGVSQPPLAYFNRAVANEGLGNVRAAYDDYRQALALAPDFTLASEQLSRFKVQTSGS
ncbi:MAG TPA: tetratricopeptide repeat protein [Rhizomicrobium sp.]|nr:tetratricopeptide repeat protein [Rhizomicrobium sp.]